MFVDYKCLQSTRRKYLSRRFFFFLTTGTSCFCAVAYGVARKFHVRPGSRTSRGRSLSTSVYLVVPHMCLTVRPWVRLRFSSCPSSSSRRRRTHDPPDGGQTPLPTTRRRRMELNRSDFHTSEQCRLASSREAPCRLGSHFGRTRK